ncbi:oligogalacturonate-specific porin KdgM family protein [Vibrio gallaecicus]|uniref:Oligogalacturonate-specific porin KdgM family protein n=1 Tax=Vibrio gallaecicus TaxID=552386 RepID=A0ABV4N8Y0_9VIBR|nr:oligogalacturonate-specific porin KdgM family protein [Vibrio gallaecicus]MDN3614351.1 oligogalacturonate-specific porin KdgM family protein [Vibrio gallaecicus]
MKKIIALSALSLAFASSAFAGSSYVTGNVQLHSDFDPSVSSTLEAGHTFDSGTTLLTEFDGISLGKYDDDAVQDSGMGNSPYITLGVEQMYNINDNLWVAAGYHHLLNNGETVQYRPLVKIGYNFDNGISISNRTRYHSMEDSKADDQTRFDNRIGYSVNEDLAVSYNNVYVMSDANNTMDHELRATWTRQGVQPYFEFRNQADNENNAFVFGASYGF